jgi:serine/threonine protein kinase
VHFSKLHQAKLDKAFQEALKLETESDDELIKFDLGLQALFPKLYSATFNDVKDNFIGTNFNQYKIISEIGSGGMCNVYKAHRNDGQFNKTVAIKVLTKGFNNQSIKQRFLREKQILAKLRHAYIVPLLDAGTTTDGIPWFVLEYIQGSSIDEFCHSKQFSTEAIVTLLLKICDAIYFAHSQGIIHRDLKPANILIEKTDGQYNPIILDFGIAHNNDEQDLTHQGHLIGTPGYMSPEQVMGQYKIDRRTDIFSMGVLMYQLYSGVKPFQAQSVKQTHDNIINNEPEKLNKLIDSFPKDLQIIVETCLSKKAKDRYQSILNLKEDLQNWQNGYPILAKKNSIIKLIWQTIKRNKTTSILIGLFLIIGLLSLAKYTYDINLEKQIAIQASAESDDLFNFLLKDLHAELTNIGRVDLLQSVAEKNIQHLNKYNFGLSSSEKLQYIDSYRNSAKVLEMQQDTSRSISAYEKAKNMLMTLDDKKLKEKSTLLALTYSDLATLYSKMGRLDFANQNHQKAQSYANILTRLKTKNANLISWQVLNAYSWNLMEQSKYDVAKIQLDNALKIAIQAKTLDNDSIMWSTNHFKSLIALGWYYVDLRENSQAIIQYQQALNIAKSVLNQSPYSIPIIHSLQKINNQMAYAYIMKHNYQMAIERSLAAVDYGKTLFSRAPNNNIFNRANSYSYSMIGNAYNSLKNYDLAEEYFKTSLEITKKIALSAPKDVSLQHDVAIDTMNFANMLNKKGKPEQALNYWQESELILEKIVNTKDPSIYYINTYVNVLLTQGKVDLAKPYLLRMKKTEGWPNKTYKELVNKFNLDMYHE